MRFVVPLAQAFSLLRTSPYFSIPRRKTFQQFKHSFLPLHYCNKFIHIHYYMTASSTVVVESSILPRLYPPSKSSEKHPEAVRSSSAADTTTFLNSHFQQWIALPLSQVSDTTPRLACTFLSGFVNGTLPRSRIRSVVNGHCTKTLPIPDPL